MKKKRKFKSEYLTFTPVKKGHHALVLDWLDKPHVSPFFYGQGLENTLRDLDRFIKGEKSVHLHWIAYYDQTPFAYLMNSEVLAEDLPYGTWIEHQVGLTLDLLIGDPDFLGHGLAAPLIQKFLRENARDYPDVFIDPALDNPRAIHVYKKAGFEKKEIFIASWDPKEHQLMKLNWDKVL